MFLEAYLEHYFSTLCVRIINNHLINVRMYQEKFWSLK